MTLRIFNGWIKDDGGKLDAWRWEAIDVTYNEIAALLDRHGYEATQFIFPAANFLASGHVPTVVYMHEERPGYKVFKMAHFRCSDKLMFHVSLMANGWTQELSEFWLTYRKEA
jgi:hypothetical protein